MTKRDAKDEKKAPKLRFKGFTDDWEQVKFGKITSKYKTRNKDGEQLRSFSVSNIYGFIPQEEQFENGGIALNADKKNSIIVTPNSFAYNPARINVGSIGYYNGNENVLVSSLYEVFKLHKEYDPNYLWFWLKSNHFNWWIHRLQEGSVRSYFYYDKFSEIKERMPSLPEQMKIGQLLKSLDHTITLHEEKQKQLEQLKKALLQKMFVDKTGYPELRFNSFNKPWEQVKLGAIYRKIRNAFVGTATPFYVSKGHFYLESNNVKEGKINTDSQKFINDTFYIKQRNKWLHTGDIVMVQSGDVGQSAVIPPELNNSAAHALIMFQEPKMNVDPRFLNVQFQGTRSKKQIGNITKGNTIKHILASDMQKFVVLFPDIEEQQSIGQLFQILDHIITLHTKKIEELKQLKQALLQQMFI